MIIQTIKALRVLLGFKARVVQTFEPPGTYETLIYPRRTVPFRSRLKVAYRIMRNVTRISDIYDLYAMQVLVSEKERRTLVQHARDGW